MKPAEFKAIRIKLGLSQAQLALKLGLAPNSVARLERGERKISKSLEILVRMIAKSS